MSDFKEKRDPNKTNFLLARQGNKERVVEISEVEIDTMFSWYEHYCQYNLRGKEHSKPAIHRLENGPLGKKICEFWMMISELQIIEKWFNVFPNPTDEDKRVFAIVDGAINPKTPQEEIKAQQENEAKENGDSDNQ